ncbi:MAG TPA: DUF2683 family protein [Paludibacter sp.]
MNINKPRVTDSVLSRKRNAWKETEYINSSPVMVERIKEARKEISEGKGKKIKTEDLWKTSFFP